MSGITNGQRKWHGYVPYTKMSIGDDGEDKMHALTLHSEYSRQDVHDIFSPDTRFTQSSGSWGLHGIVEIPNKPGDFVFFVTFGQHQAGHTFDEWITEKGMVSWQSQPRQSFQDRRIQQFIHHDDKKNSIHLFLRTQRTASYTYLGKLRYLACDPARERPVYMYWQLLNWPIPEKVLNQMQLVLQTADFQRAIREQKADHHILVEDDNMGFIWRGKFWKVDRDELINQVREWIALGLPEEATRSKRWYIEIDGVQVSPKWLFNLITKAGYDSFITTEGRTKLAQIGFKAIQFEGQRRIIHPHDINKNKPKKYVKLYIEILENRMELIHSVLGGSTTPPIDETICDWVHFCYDFGLYKEGQMLFTLVTSEQVNHWYYDRTKKLARLCSMRSIAKD